MFEAFTVENESLCRVLKDQPALCLVRRTGKCAYGKWQEKKTDRWDGLTHQGRKCRRRKNSVRSTIKSQSRKSAELRLVHVISSAQSVENWTEELSLSLQSINDQDGCSKDKPQTSLSPRARITSSLTSPPSQIHVNSNFLFKWKKIIEAKPRNAGHVHSVTRNRNDDVQQIEKLEFCLGSHCLSQISIPIP